MPDEPANGKELTTAGEAFDRAAREGKPLRCSDCGTELFSPSDLIHHAVISHGWRLVSNA